MLIYFIHEHTVPTTCKHYRAKVMGLQAGKVDQIVYIINSEIMTQVNQNLTYDRLSSEIYLCTFCLKHERETQNLIFGGRKFQSDAPEKERLLLNKRILGLGNKYRLLLELV